MSAKTVEQYLEALPDDARAALVKLRNAIREAAPMASETISMGAPAYKHRGMLVSFAAAKRHCSFYVMSESAINEHKDELEAYDTAKTAIKFPAGKPLPDDLVKRLVQTRIRENEGRRAA